ncbi:MAG: ABC transporter substrate-binding protein [Gammaproteobacteria bacterium]|nr:ABC transporter substrate-binding protein [Gammaproteobacteria bacterium]
MRKVLLTNLLFALFGCFLVSNIALAADPAPLALVKQMSNQTITALKKNKAQLHNQSTIRAIVYKIIVPQFDLVGASRSVVGRNYWYQASKSTQSQFIKAFTNYVVDMYSGALSSYKDEVVTFKPIRNFISSQTRVQVYSMIQRSGVQPIKLNYRLIKQGGSWKIYDFSVDGVSMIQSYRAQFASALQRSGLAGLTKELQSRNR